jgi:hypothetical protein
MAQFATRLVNLKLYVPTQSRLPLDDSVEEAALVTHSFCGTEHYMAVRLRMDAPRF